MYREIRELLLIHSERHAPYLQDCSRILSYSDVFQIAERNAADLRKWGVGGLHCVLLADNSIEFCLAFWSLVFASCIPIPVNPTMSAREVLEVLRAADTNWVLTTKRRSVLGEAMHASCAAGWIEVDGRFQLSLMMVPSIAGERRAGRDIASMLLSSGTTGLPKLVQLTHRNLLFVAAAHNDRLGLGNADRVLIVLRLFHASAFVSQFLAHTLAGGTIVLYDEPFFTPKAFCRWIGDYGITCSSVVPTIVRFLLDYRYIADHDPSQLRYLCCAGDVLQQDLAVALAACWRNTSLVRTYGLTETATRVSYLFPKEALLHPASIGKPLAQVYVKILEEPGSMEGTSSVGEILVRGPNVMPGYYAHDGSLDMIVRDGWLHTGDIGRYNDRGDIDFIGRLKNTIITRGINVSPEEVERAICEHSSVRDIRVYGVPDPIEGERICAQIVLRERESMELSELHLFLRERLATYKYPKLLEVVQSIKRTATGKLLRRGD